MLLNLLGLLAVAAVAVFGALQRLYGAVVMLVSLVLGGAVAAVLGPALADLLGGGAGPRDTWWYTADAVAFWAVLCLVFLGLRTAGHRLLPNEPPLPTAAQTAGGAVAGAVAGYLAVGLCLIIVQMLPLAPSVLGYEPFRYREGASRNNPERIERGDVLWLAPDRAAVWLLDAVTGGAVLGRYGDAYPPERLRPPEYQPAVDTDDFLYYHWYRRWQAIRWRTGRVMGPVTEVPPGQEGLRGLALKRAREGVLFGMDLEVSFAVRSEKVPGFADVPAPDGHEFLQVRLRMKPEGRLPRTIDSAQFRLVDASGEPVADRPLVTGDARKATEAGAPPRALGSAERPHVVLRNPRFTFPGDGDRGAYAATGLRLEFTEPGQYATRTLVFTVPASLPTDGLRLYMDPQVPPLAEVNQETWPEAPASTK
ncbi:MAG: hypothetical protein R6X20_05775 [Phycisphaerae bacterium]